MREHSLIGASLSSIADVESDYRFLVTGSYLTFTEFLTTMSMWIVCSTAAGIIFASSLEMCRTTKQTNRDNLLHREKRFVTGTVCRDAGGFFLWQAYQNLDRNTKIKSCPQMITFENSCSWG